MISFFPRNHAPWRSRPSSSTIQFAILHGPSPSPTAAGWYWLALFLNQDSSSCKVCGNGCSSAGKDDELDLLNDEQNDTEGWRLMERPIDRLMLGLLLQMAIAAALSDAGEKVFISHSSLNDADAAVNQTRSDLEKQQRAGSTTWYLAGYPGKA